MLTKYLLNVGDTEAWVFLAYGVPSALAKYVKVESAWLADSAKTVFEDTDAKYNYTVVIPAGSFEAGKEVANSFKFTLDSTIDIDPDGKWNSVISGSATELNWTNANGNPMVYINAYAIQKDANIDTIDKAIAAYSNQWGGLKVDNAVAPVLVATAEELTAALANGESVALTDDVTVASTIKVLNGSDVKLNLNGHKLSYAVSNTSASAIINVEPKAALEITGEGTISFVAANPDMQEIPGYATNTITNEGTLVIGEGVVVTNGSDGSASYAVDNKGKFTLNGGTLIGKVCALRIAKYNQDNVEFVMNGGLVKAATPAWIQLPGSSSADAPTITVTINDGTFQSTKTPSSADNNVLYTYSFGNSHANTSITINGGMFLGGTVSIGSGYKGDAPALTINGGTFEYDVMQWLKDDGSQVFYSASGIKSVSTTEKLNEAIANGGDILLTGDVSFANDIAEDANINLNGNTLTMISSNQEVSKDLTVSNGTVDVSKGYFDVRTSTENEVVFENVTFTNTKLSKTTGNSTDRVESALEVCPEVLGGKTIVTFRNCTFNNANVLFEAMSGKAGEVTAVFENCTFNNFGNSDAIEVSNYLTVDITIKDCTFNMTATSNVKIVDALTSSTVTVTFEGTNTVNGVAATPTDASLKDTVDEIRVFSTQSVKVVSTAIDTVNGLDTVYVEGIATK